MNRTLFTKKRLLIIPTLFVLGFSMITPLLAFTPALAAPTSGANCQDFTVQNTAALFASCLAAHPSTYSSKDPAIQLLAYQYANALATCMVQSTGDSQTDVANGNLFVDAATDGSILAPSADYQVTLGTTLLGTSNRSGVKPATNGRVFCNPGKNNSTIGKNWVNNALNLLGWGGQYTQFVCELGASRLGGGACTGSNGSRFAYPDNRDAILSAIQNKFYGQGAAQSSMSLTGPQKYVLYRDAFLIPCLGNQNYIAPVATATIDQKNQAQVTLNIVSATDGTITPTYYKVQDTGSDEIDQHLSTALDRSAGNGDVDILVPNPGCAHIPNIANQFANDYSTYVKFGLDAPSVPPVTTQDDCQNNRTANGDCAAQSSYIDCAGGSFSWLVCPFIELASNAAQKMDNFIMNTLDVDVGPIFDNTDTAGSQSQGYYTAWNSFRIIAIAFIIIAGLVMVISQALGFELLDAYTIRRVLPRLLIGIIAISLSWPLMRLVVSFFNTLGFDVRALIYSPFTGPAWNVKYSISTGVLSTLGVGAAIFIMGPASLTIIITVLIAVFVGFLTLVVREIALIMLIIVAPIGIACFILPNTQRVWRLWYENFLGLLAAFPLISAMIAAGHVFAVVCLKTDTSTGGDFSVHAMGLVSHFTMHGFWQTMGAAGNDAGSTVAQGAALVGEYGPLGLIPKAVSMTTGAISTLAGGSGGFLNGIKGGLSKARSNSAGNRWSKLQKGDLYNPNSKMAKVLGGRAINRVGAHIGAGVQGRYGFGKVGQAARAARSIASADTMARENEVFGEHMKDESVMAAAAYGYDRKKLATLRHFQEDDGSLKRNADGTFLVDSAIDTAKSMGPATQRLRTASLDALAKSGKVIQTRSERKALASDVALGDAKMTDMLDNQYKYTSRQVGRADIGRDTDKESLEELDVYSLGREKPLSLENLFGVRGIATAGADGRIPPILQAIADSPDEQAQHFADLLLAAQYSPGTSPQRQQEIRQAIETVSTERPDLWRGAEDRARSRFATESAEERAAREAREAAGG